MKPRTLEAEFSWLIPSFDHFQLVALQERVTNPNVASSLDISYASLDEEHQLLMIYADAGLTHLSAQELVCQPSDEINIELFWKERRDFRVDSGRSGCPRASRPTTENTENIEALTR